MPHSWKRHKRNRKRGEDIREDGYLEKVMGNELQGHLSNKLPQELGLTSTESLQVKKRKKKKGGRRGGKVEGKAGRGISF